MPSEENLEDYEKVATVDEIPEGRGIGVEVNGIEIAIFNANGDFYALNNRCAHQRAPLCNAGEEKLNSEHTWTKTRGTVDEECLTVSCPWHLWDWDLETGEHTASNSRIATFDVWVDGDDILVRI